MRNIVLLSGGLDSFYALHLANKNSHSTRALFFNYGQITSNLELNAAKAMCDLLNCELLTIDLTTNNLSFLFKSDYTNSKNTDKNPNTFNSTVINRNLLFITMAYNMAILDGFNTIYTGICQNLHKSIKNRVKAIIDAENSYGIFGIVADQTTLFAKKSEELLNYLNPEHNVKIKHPALFEHKSYIYTYFYKQGLIDFTIDTAYSCFYGESIKFSWGIGCEKCVPCKTRKNAYEFYLLSK